MKKTDTTAVRSVVICGVGGQGIILASDVLSTALFTAGFDVKKNEIHGMSQREGAVISFVRYGRRVHSPVVPDGGADCLLGFEILETLRTLKYLRNGGAVIANEQEIHPTPVLLGKAEYPSNAKDVILARTKTVLFIKALDIAKALGNPKAVNTVLLGALSRHLEKVGEKAWEDALRRHVKNAFLNVNLEAFRAGRDIH